MTSTARRYKLIPLAVVLLVLDLAAFALLPGHRSPLWSALATMAGLDLVLVFVWLVAATLTARLRLRQQVPRLDFDHDSYWAKREAKPRE